MGSRLRRNGAAATESGSEDVRRVFWLAVGATAGVYVVRKVTRTAHAFTPAGVAERAGTLAEALRYFADEVRAAMSEREAELREALELRDDEPDRFRRPLRAGGVEHPAPLRRVGD